MSYQDVAQSIEVISTLMKWEMHDRLHWDADVSTLEYNSRGQVVWSVTPKVGGPVKIYTDTFGLEKTSIKALVTIATELVESASKVALHSNLRDQYEQDMKRTAKSLLRRKSADGMRLVSVASQPISTGYYRESGIDVIFESEINGVMRREKLDVGDEEELKRKFEALIASREQVQRWAA